MKEKSETLEKFKGFKLMVESKVRSKIQCLCTDNGGEYISNKFSSYLVQCKIR